MKYLGCSYYPEDFGIGRMAVDIQLMKEAGINMVRIGEFAWSRMEPHQGVYDLGLFRDSIKMFADNDIKVMMCTPTAAPPAWLTHNFPDTLVCDPLGHKARHGMRQQCCYNSSRFLDFSRKITEALTCSLADCENIVIWQIDNELAQRLVGACSCDACQTGFREYLKEKYKTTNELNHCWKNEFWSHSYSDWEEITLAFPECLWTKSPQIISNNYAVSRVLDSLRFYEKIIKEYMLEQVKIIRRNIPKAVITTNNPVDIFDLRSFYRDLDIVSADIYWEDRRSFISAYHLLRYRSYKDKPFLIAETGLGYDYLVAAAGQKPAKTDMWRAFAYGAASYLIFRWRPPLGGQEQTALCPLTPSGQPRNTYFLAKEMFNEVNALRDELADMEMPDIQAAILFDSEVEKSYLRHNYGVNINYNLLITNIIEQMQRRNIPTAFIAPDSSLEGIKLLILPSQRIVRRELAEKIEEFVRSGGTVWAIGELNNADENGNFITETAPQHLKDVFGLTLYTGASIPSRRGAVNLQISGSLNGKMMNFEFDGGWLADIEKDADTETLMKFVNGYYYGQDAVVIHKYGKGYAFYLGISKPGTELFSELSETILKKTDIKWLKNCPPGVEIIDCKTAIFVINASENNCCFELPVSGKALLGDFDSQRRIVSLDAWDVCIIKR